MESPQNTLRIIEELSQKLVQQSMLLRTAESCTGGLLAAFCTQISGSSAWFDCAQVTYSNDAKMQLLGVKETTLAAYGAVSLEVACEMVTGLCQASSVKNIEKTDNFNENILKDIENKRNKIKNIENKGIFGVNIPDMPVEYTKKHWYIPKPVVGIAITGIAGPLGGSPTKPVGLVCFAWCVPAFLEGKASETAFIGAQIQHFNGNRQQIREQAAHFAVQQLLLLLS